MRFLLREGGGGGREKEGEGGGSVAGVTEHSPELPHVRSELAPAAPKGTQGWQS